MPVVNHYLGDHASDAVVNTYIAVTGWPNEDMSGQRSYTRTGGLQYRNTTTGNIRTYNGSAWEDEARVRPVTYAAADAATPSVAGGISVLMLPANTAPLAITNLTGGYLGQLVTLVATSATNTPTIADAGNFVLSAGWAPGIDDTITLMNVGATWAEVGRSNN